MPARLTPVDGGPAYRLEKPIVLIGRHEDCDLALPEQVKISRRHCCVARVDDRYIVRDLASMNGVRVNGTRVIEAALQPGDQLAIADTVFLFENGPLVTGEEARFPSRTNNTAAERMSNQSGDVVLVPVDVGDQVFSALGEEEAVDHLPSHRPPCDFDAEDGLRGLSADLLPTPRMVEPSCRDEIVPAPLSPLPTSDSQSGLRFIGA
jgi:pSer/pThr/pTyr-binding forkhead associated (FHA) protein